MTSVDDITQQLHDKESELFAATREIDRLQSQLDESRERESHLASEHESDNLRNNDRISVLVREHEELSAKVQELAIEVRQAEDRKRNDDVQTQRLERELRTALLELHAKENEIADLLKKQRALFEVQEKYEVLKKRVVELEEMHREGREQYKFEALKVRELEEKMSVLLVSLEESKSESHALSEVNERLREELHTLLSSASSPEATNRNFPVPALPLRSRSDPPESEAASPQYLNGERLDTNVVTCPIDCHDLDYARTPRRGSICTGSYSEPLLRDETVVGLPTNRGTCDRETQTVTQMSEETDEQSNQSCPQCVIC